MDATNGTTDRQRLRDAKAKHRAARLTYETKLMEHQTRLLESWYYEDFTTSDPWNRLRGPDSPFYRDEPPSHPSDRKHGENWPLYRVETDLDRLRQQSRMLCISNTFAKGLLRNLTNYTIGKGFTYKAQAGKKIDADSKKPGQQVPPEVEALVADVQDVIDQFCKANRWNCAADPLAATVQAATREREAYRRVHRDGETFFRLFFDAKTGTTAVRFVEPEQVRQPPIAVATYADGWSFGIRHKRTEGGGEDVETPEEYHVVYQDPTDDREGLGEIVPADEIVHVKHPDEDAAQKRGTPTFSFEMLQALERASKLQRNSSLGASVRAATAEVWKHNSATQEQMTSLANGLGERQQENPLTGRLENIERIRPGTIRRIDSGWEPVPYAPVTGVAEHGQAVQGDLRLASAAVCAPEYLTGDASNANYASTKEAGTPFVLSAQGEQEHFKAAYLAVIWRAVRWAAECGRIDKRALKLVEIQVEAPAVQQRDSLQKAQEDQILVGIGKSPQTVLMEAGLDPEVESTNVQEWQDRHGGMGGLGGLGLGGGDDGGFGGGGGGLGGLKLPGMESRALREGAEWDESKHPRDHGQFASKEGASGGSGDNSGGSDKPQEGSATPKRDSSKFGSHIHSDYKIAGVKDRPGFLILTKPDGKEVTSGQIGFDAELSRAMGAGWLHAFDEDLAEAMDGDDEAKAQFLDHLSKGQEKLKAAVEKEWGELATDEDRARLQEALGALHSTADDFFDEAYEDEEYDASDALQAFEDAADHVTDTIREIYDDQAQRQADQETQWEQDTESRLDDLDGTDDEDGAEEAAELNVSQAEEGNPYRIHWDGVGWSYAHADDLEDWPGKDKSPLQESLRWRWRRRGRWLREAKEEDPADPKRLEAIADILAGIFGDDALEFLDQADLLEAWNPDDHPRGKGGKFIPKGSAEAVSTAKDAVRKALKGKRTPETTKQIMDHLSILTTKQLHDLKREYNLSASGKAKQELVAKLADRLAKGRSGDEEQGEYPTYAEWGKQERESGEEPAVPQEEKPAFPGVQEPEQHAPQEQSQLPDGNKQVRQKIGELKQKYGEDFMDRLRSVAAHQVQEDAKTGNVRIRASQLSGGGFRELKKGDVVLMYDREAPHNPGEPIPQKPLVVDGAKKVSTTRHADAGVTGYWQDISLREPKESEKDKVEVALNAMSAHSELKDMSTSMQWYADSTKNRLDAAVPKAEAALQKIKPEEKPQEKPAANQWDKVPRAQSGAKTTMGGSPAAKRGDSWYVQRADGTWGLVSSRKSEAELDKRVAVESALASGKPVPPEVLADYPDLQAKYGGTAAPKPRMSQEDFLASVQKDAPSLVAAPEDAKVKVQPNKDGSVRILVHSPTLDAERRAFRDGDKKVMENVNVEVQEKGTGIGSRMFQQQVEALKQNGFDEIRSAAERSDGMIEQNGYYTLPRFGYDQPIGKFKPDVQRKIKQQFPDAKSVLDIMQTPEGREWWKKNGVTMEHAVFDLKDGSRSMQVLDAYKAERAARKVRESAEPQKIRTIERDERGYITRILESVVEDMG